MELTADDFLKWNKVINTVIQDSSKLFFQKGKISNFVHLIADLRKCPKTFYDFFNGLGKLLYYEVHTITFQTFFVWAFKIVIDSWKFTMLLLYILWDDWPIFMISGSNQQLQKQLEYTLLKPDCHSWWISKIQSDTLEEQYAIKFCFKLGKNATETYGMLQTAFRPSCMNWASVFERHKRFKEGTESVRDDERCGRSKEVNTPELIGVRVTMLRF